MAQATRQLITGVDIEQVLEGLDRVRSSHLVSMHWAQTVGDRLEGPALFLLAAELEEVASESCESANALGERIAELDGEATGDPTRLIERSTFSGFELPTNYADVAEIMRIGLDHIRSLIRAYGHLLDATRNTDELSHHLLLEQVAQQAKREAELEGALVREAER